MSVDLTARPLDNECYAVHCSDCGPVSIETVESVHEACVAHLKDSHDAERVQWRVGDTRWEQA